MSNAGRPKGTGNFVAASRAAFHAEVCPRCGAEANITSKTIVCSPCKDFLTRVARDEQERAYLANYLSTREDDTDKTTVRLRKSALDQGIDWTHPPAPLAFADRMAALMAPYRPHPDQFTSRDEEAS
jgi:hypothetical protein